MLSWLVQREAIVRVVVALVALLGAISYFSLPREAAPDVKIPVVMVSTPYIGVSPEDIESLVTIPIENELAGVKDLKKMSSTSAEGVSIISLEFEPDVVVEEALQRVRDRVDRARPRLPEDAEDPEVSEISFSDFPILIVTIAGPLDEEKLKGLAESLEDEVTRIPGVLDTRLSGGLEREIRVEVDPRRLSSYGLSLGDVLGGISGENVNIPAGEVASGDSNYLLRVPGQFAAPAQLEQVAIKRVGDRPVFIRDIGRVIDGYRDRESYARMDGEAAVSIAVTKRAGANILDIADAVKALAASHAQRWPEGVHHRVLSDQSKFIRNMVTELENNIITALLLVVAVIIVVMGGRSSIFIAAAIPLSMMMAMIVIEALGITLNMMVLFSLILALGMFVDNGIVVVENVYRHIQEGKDMVTASIEGTAEVAIPVISSTATNVAAYVPVLFWSGIMGEFMGYLPKTIIIVLGCSIIVSVGFLPVYTARFLKVAALQRDDEDQLPQGWGMDQYRRLLLFSIRHRYVASFGVMVMMVLSLVAYGIFNHGVEFFPNTEPNRATITVRTPDGTDLDSTDRIARRIEAGLAQVPNIDVFVAEVGVGGGGDPMAGAQSQPTAATINVDFLPHRNEAEEGETPRDENSNITLERIRAMVQGIPGAEIEVEKERMGPPVGAPISVEVTGEEFHAVGRLAAQVRREIAQIDGVTDLVDNYRVGRPELRLRVDRGAARRVGASTADVGNAVRTAVAGTKASALRDGKDEYDIVVVLDPRYREDLQQVLGLQIPGRLDTSPNTFPVPISAVASYELAGGSGSIRHVDQELVVTISGDVTEGKNQNVVQEEVKLRLEQLQREGKIPPGMNARLGGASDEQAESAAFLAKAFLIAVGLVGFVLVMQFNSYRLPFIIMMSVVLSLIGVLWGLLLTGTPFGVIMTGLGVIALAGVVVNNAIVLLDYIELLRERGMGAEEALIRGGMTRFRPVVLSAITTVLGLVPMALGVSLDFVNLRVLVGGASAEWWGPMAIAIIFGQSFATVLTLVVVPTLYQVFEDLLRLEERVKVWMGRGAAAALLVFCLPASADPLTLQQAWTAAEAHSAQLRLAEEQRVQAETLRGQALALISPKLSAEASYTINEKEIAFDPTAMIPEEFAAVLGDMGDSKVVIQEKTALAASASLIQPLFSGAALPAWRGAQASVEAARRDESRARQQVRAAVAQAWYGLWVARETEALAAQAVGSAEGHLELARRQVEAGSMPRRVLLQAELGMAQARRQLSQAQEGRISAELALARLTGLSGPREPVEPPALAGPASLEAALSAARSQRPDLQAAEARASAQRAALQARRAGWLPSLDGRFTYAYSENTGFSDDPTTWMLVAQANWLLWDGGMRVAQARQEQSRLRSAELLMEDGWAQAEQEVRAAWEQRERAESGLRAAESELRLAEENLKLAEVGLSAGAATWLDVQDARVSLGAARSAGLQERARADLARIALLLATGEL